MAYTTTTSSAGETLVGTSGKDAVVTLTTTKNVQVNAYEGDDAVTLNGAATSGSVGMGGGKDTVNVGGTVSELTFTLGDGADSYTQTAANTSVTVGGQGGADEFVLVTGGRFNSYGGGAGKDTFTGALGLQDSIKGGSEDDTFGAVGNGIDLGQLSFINGQLGKDTIYVDTAAANATVRGGSEDDTITVVTGGNSAILYGDKGADTLTGNADADELFGGGGADTLNGGAGSDKLTGGLGKDNFVIGETAAANVAAIQDFTVSDDKIQVTAASYAAYTAGGTVNLTTIAGFAAGAIIVDTQANIVAADLSATQAGLLAIASDTGNIIYDADGNFTALTQIVGTVDAGVVSSLTASNFVLA